MFRLVTIEKLNCISRELASLKTDLTKSMSVIDMIEKEEKVSISSGGHAHHGDLSDRLAVLRERLTESREKEEINSWKITGLAKIALLFHEGVGTFDKTLDTVLSVLVHYVKANQAAFYFLSRDGKRLELTTAYAYGKKKYIGQSIATDEGLVGQTFLEGSYTYMTDVPGNYVKITSGLGEATPSSIFIVPLKTRTTTVGVLELAFFEKLKPYKIQFLEEAASTIANSIFLIQSSDENKRLLDSTREATRELKSKEEELLRNLEQLRDAESHLRGKNTELENARQEIEIKKNELEEIKKREYELIESKLNTQQVIHEMTLKKLHHKIAELEKKISAPVYEQSLN